MRIILPFILGLAVLTSSCSTLKDLASMVEKGKTTLVKIEEGANKVATLTRSSLDKIQEAQLKADTNKDGTTSSTEWLWYILGLLGLGGAGKLVQRNMKSDERKTGWRRESMRWKRRKRNDDILGGGVIMLLPLLLTIPLSFSCQTVAAIQAAPEDFWLTAESILLALVQDIWSIVKLLT